MATNPLRSQFEAPFPPADCYLPTPQRPLVIAYSGGKDSMAVMQLAVDHYGADCCIGCIWYMVPGMDFTASISADATERWGVRMVEVPHFALSSWLRDGTFCDPLPDTPRLTLKDLEQSVYRSTGAQWSCYGYRKHESLERNAMLTKDYPGGYSVRWRRMAPIADWSRRTTLAFLKYHNMPVPLEMAASGRASGHDIKPAAMYWLRRYWPADYRRLLAVLPYAHAQADRYDPLTGKVRP